MKTQRSLFLYCLRPGDFRKEAPIKGKKFTLRLRLTTSEVVYIMPFTIKLLHKCRKEYFKFIFLVCLCAFVSSSNEKTLSRRARLAQLCTYLQERYKHLCRQDRAATRHSRYRYAFRKALLHAASKDPDCTAQLIQKLSKNSQASAGCVKHRLCSVNTWIVYVCFNFQYLYIYFFSSRSAVPPKYERTMCAGTTKGQNCSNVALPFSRHCFQRIL